MSGDFTRLGCSIWEWEPWIHLDASARILWLGLYTSPEARRNPPGLWHGSIHTMSEASKLDPDTTRGALDTLLERELVEFEIKLRVLRLVTLPDCGEYPSNGHIIRSWWRDFKRVPSCTVRDAHVRTLRWIMDEGARLSGKLLSHHHEEAWRDTFGTVPEVAARRRGVRRLAESDTSTDIQPSLFPSRAPETVSVTVPDASSDASLPPSPSEIVKRINPGTLEPFANGWEKEKEKEREKESDLSGSGESVRGGHDSRLPPALYVIPKILPQELVDVLAGKAGTMVAEDAWDALRETIRVLDRNGVGPPEIALVGEWLRQDNRAAREAKSTRGDPFTKLSVWATNPAAIMRALADARDHKTKTEERGADLRQAMATLGLKPPEGS